MLLKDLNIKINPDAIECFANLVIKRNGKHYQVPLRTRDDFKDPLDISPNRIKENIDHFIELAERYSENYHFFTESELTKSSTKLVQEEIEL